MGRKGEVRIFCGAANNYRGRYVAEFSGLEIAKD